MRQAAGQRDKGRITRERKQDRWTVGGKKGQGAGLRDGERSVRGRGIESAKYRLEEGQRDRERMRGPEPGRRVGERKTSDKQQARGRGAGGRKDRRKERGIQKASEGQGGRKWDTEKKRGMGSRTLG